MPRAVGRRVKGLLKSSGFRLKSSGFRLEGL